MREQRGEQRRLRRQRQAAYAGRLLEALLRFRPRQAIGVDGMHDIDAVTARGERARQPMDEHAVAAEVIGRIERRDEAEPQGALIGAGDVFEHLHHRVGARRPGVGLRALESPRPQIGVQRRIAQHLENARGDRCVVVGIEEQSGAAQHFGQRVAVARDDRQPAGHRLECRQAEALALRRQREHRRRVVQPDQVLVRARTR